jgi:hypothetical protein
MVDFFDAVANWADAKDKDVIFVRDFDDEDESSGLAWWAIVKMRDGRGPYQAEIKAMKQIKRSRKDKDGNEIPPETDEQFQERVEKKISMHVFEATKARVHAKPLAFAA